MYGTYVKLFGLTSYLIISPIYISCSLSASHDSITSSLQATKKFGLLGE